LDQGLLQLVRHHKGEKRERCSEIMEGIAYIRMVSVETENDALEGRSTSCRLRGSRRRGGWIRVEID
jgi:hypothetical protein